MKKILLVFSDEWIAYSPSIINLISILKIDFDVTVIAFDNGLYDNSTLFEDKHIHFITLPSLPTQVLGVLHLYKPLKALLLLYYLRRYTVDEVIAVDSVALWSVTRYWTECHYFSLEISRDFFFRHVKHECIKSIIIQSSERLNYLFSKTKIPIYYLPNSPIMKHIPAFPIKQRYWEVVYLGNVIPGHGIFLYIKAIKYCKNIRLTIKGRIRDKVYNKIIRKYSDEIESGRLILDKSYIPQEQVVEYLSGFHIGLCLYDFNYIDKADFNYISSPSGKLFAYYAAGVPVVASDIIGMKSIKEFKTGYTISLSDSSSKPEIIAKSIQNIIKNHNYLRTNCLKAASHFDFYKRANLFKEALLDR
jgi:glycosyltransferase involved in cell wall biosynthesis